MLGFYPISSAPISALLASSGATPHHSGPERLRETIIAKVDRALAAQLMNTVYDREALERLAVGLRGHMLPSERSGLQDALGASPEVRYLLENAWSLQEIYALLSNIVDERDDEQSALLFSRYL